MVGRTPGWRAHDFRFQIVPRPAVQAGRMASTHVLRGVTKFWACPANAKAPGSTNCGAALTRDGVFELLFEKQIGWLRLGRLRPSLARFRPSSGQCRPNAGRFRAGRCRPKHWASSPWEGVPKVEGATTEAPVTWGTCGEVRQVNCIDSGTMPSMQNSKEHWNCALASDTGAWPPRGGQA